MRNYRILVTGGHLAPALAFLDALKARQITSDVTYAGRDKPFERSAAVSPEKEAVEAKGATFVPITAGRIERGLGITALISLLKIPMGIIEAIRIVGSAKPDVVVSFGGYVAWPLVVAARMRNIPLITHEQTRVPGLANRFIAPFVHTVCVSFPETKNMLSSKHTVVTGLPLRASLFDTTLAPIVIEQNAPILYVTGGTTGAQSLNQLLFPILPTLVRSFTVVHQTGSLDIDQAVKLKDSLPLDVVSHYYPFAYLQDAQAAWTMQHAELVVGRSGANTVYEVGALGKIALFLPLPWSGGGEQEKNAHYLVSQGSALVVDQKKISAEALLHEIESMWTKRVEYQAHAATLAPTFPRDGATRLVDEVVSLLPKNV